MNTHILRYVPSIITTMLLSGCAQMQSLVGPDYQHPKPSFPSQWSFKPPPNAGLVPGPTHNLARWWQQLGDPQLNGLINAALAGNLDLRLAQARLRQARLTRGQALSELSPSLSVSTGATDSQSVARTGAFSRTSYEAGFDANWEIDIFGGKRRGIEAATADQAASEANLNHAKVSLVAEVARNYVELRTYQQRLKIAQDNLASQSETLQLIELYYQTGRTTKSAMDQARTNLEQTRAKIPDLEVGQATAKNRLAVLLGRNPGALNAQLSKLKSWPALPAKIGTGIPADVLRQRPDLIAAERTLAAETARVGQKLAKRFPSLNLGASFGWQTYSLSALGGTGTLIGMLSGTLAATLFDGGKLRSAVAIQSAVQEQALISYQNRVLTALEEIENALIAYAAGRERVKALQAATEAARSAAALSRSLYQTGHADFQTILETERTRLGTEDNLAIAEAYMRTSLIKLYKVMGGGWKYTI